MWLFFMASLFWIYFVWQDDYLAWYWNWKSIIQDIIYRHIKLVLNILRFIKLVIMFPYLWVDMLLTFQREIKEDRGMLFNLLNLILYYGILVITLLTVCWLVILGIGLFQILS